MQICDIDFLGDGTENVNGRIKTGLVGRTYQVRTQFFLPKERTKSVQLILNRNYLPRTASHAARKRALIAHSSELSFLCELE